MKYSKLLELPDVEGVSLRGIFDIMVNRHRGGGREGGR